MIAIYDFDGTLTPHSLPQYQILKQCGYTDKKIMDRVTKEMAMGRASDFYNAYYKCYMDILAENGIPMSKENICLGAKEVKLNEGVEEYFKKFQSSKTGVKHYVVTSGVRDYVEETVISNLVDGIFGVTFNKKNGIFQSIDFLMSDKKKIDIIEAIRSRDKGKNRIMYFGDGLTDKFAFEHVHEIGGKSIFIASNERSEGNYQKLNINGIIDEYFESDFSNDSKVSRYMEQQISRELEEECR